MAHEQRALRNLAFPRQLKFWLRDDQRDRFRSAVPALKRSEFLRDLLDEALDRRAAEGRPQADAGGVT